MRARSILLVVLTACSSESSTPAETVPLASDAAWPKFRGDAAQTGQGKFGPSNSTSNQPWVLQTAKGIFSSAVIDGKGTSYIGSADRTFYAIDRNGQVKWSLLCGEIIDSSALLDDRGHLYFGAGDGKLRALDAETGAPLWTFQADDPSVNKSFINWFEGNVAIGKDGTLYAPNDVFFVYAIDRDTGTAKWRFKMPDQTWSLPAIDATTGMAYVGNNNLVPAMGGNTFAIAPDGQNQWEASSLGSTAASPMIAGDRVFVGGFDGYLRSFDKKTGDELWEIPTRDHLYASPALSRDGSVIQPGADGTIYAVDASTGATKWTFDVLEPVRSSPAIDIDGNIYFGGGDGKLWVLNPNGSLRWSMQLISDVRNDLNSSPSLGPDGIVIAGESGQIFGIPYDFCLRTPDARCNVTPAAHPDSASLLFVTPLGSTETDPPAASNANDPITLALDVRTGDQTRLATFDTTSLVVESTPHVDFDVHVAGDGKFVTLAPKTPLAGATSIHVQSNYLVDHDRAGLRLSGGHVGGVVERTIAVNPRALGDMTLTPGMRWEMSRLALPLPTLLPSYNQIGFDSLHWMIGVVEPGVAWMIGAKLADGKNETIVDPTTHEMFPLDVTKNGDLVTLGSGDAMRFEAMNIVLPLNGFRLSARLLPTGDADGPVALGGATICHGVPFYGQFLQTLGLCNPTTDELVVAGGANLKASPATATTGIGDVTLTRDPDAMRATFTNSTVKPGEHVVGLLLVDTATNRPVTLEYGLQTERKTDAAGVLTEVRVPFGDRQIPANLRVHVMVDTASVFSR